MANIYANLLEQKKAFAQEKSTTPRGGLVWDTNMAAVSLFWDTNMAAVTSCENTLDVSPLMAAILIFKCTALAGRGARKNRLPNRPRHLSSFDTHARWQPVTQSARSRWSYGKIEDCEHSSNCLNSKRWIVHKLNAWPRNSNTFYFLALSEGVLPHSDRTFFHFLTHFLQANIKPSSRVKIDMIQRQL